MIYLSPDGSDTPQKASDGTEWVSATHAWRTVRGAAAAAFGVGLMLGIMVACLFR